MLTNSNIEIPYHWLAYSRIDLLTWVIAVKVYVSGFTLIPYSATNGHSPGS